MKNRIVAALLSLFLGGLGVHKFYLQQTFAGAMYFLFCWTGVPALLALFDAISYFVMSDLAFEEHVQKINEKNAQSKAEPSAWYVVVIVVGIAFIIAWTIIVMIFSAYGM